MSENRAEFDERVIEDLKTAVEATDCDSVTRLIGEYGLDLLETVTFTEIKYPAIVYAALRAWPDMVTCLAEAGADINSKASDGNLALYVATANGHYGIVELLLRLGADINAVNSGGRTALHAAAWYRQYDVISLLMERGIDYTIPDHQGATALYVAKATKNEQTFNTIQDAQRKRQRNEQRVHVPPMDACHAARTSAEETQLPKPSNDGYNLLETEDPSNPDRTASTSMIIDNRSVVTVYNRLGNGSLDGDQEQAVDTSVEQQFSVAVTTGDVERVRGILRNHDNPARLMDTCTIESEKVLIYAIQRDLYNMVKYFLEAGADPNCRDKYGSYALHHAVSQCDADIAKLLINHGANVNAQNQDGATPLYLACTFREAEIYSMLMNKGADPTIATKAGGKPHMVARGWDINIFNALKEKVNEKRRLERRIAAHAPVDDVTEAMSMASVRTNPAGPEEETEQQQ